MINREPHGSLFLYTVIIVSKNLPGTLVNFKLPIISTLILGLLTGCASTTKTTGLENLVIAEPLPINQQSELALARLSEIIAKVEVTEEQRAKLYYDRGVIYDSVGLRGLASFDFQRALRLKPDMVDAYNFIGIHATQRQEFLQAFEAFDSAIELNPNHDYAYLNRGIALYYGGRPELGIADIEKFHAREQEDPYRIAWLYLLEREIDPIKASDHLKTNMSKLNHGSWANNILKLYLGDLSESEFLQTMPQGVSSSQELTNRLCEGYFYLGKYNLHRGNKNAAANYFKLALSTNVYEFIEHRYAKLELALMYSITAPSKL